MSDGKTESRSDNPTISEKPDEPEDKNLVADPLEEPEIDEPVVEPEVKEEPEPEPAAKIEYTDFTLPKGVELSAEDLDAFKAEAAELGLDQGAAQKLIDRHVKAVQAQGQQMTELWADTQKKWQDEVKADPEIGGAKLPEVRTTIGKALAEYGAPGLKKALIITGAGNHPAMIKTLYNMARALTEGGHVAGNPPKAKAKPDSLAAALYPETEDAK